MEGEATCPRQFSSLCRQVRSSTSEPIANCVGVCVGATTALAQHGPIDVMKDAVAVAYSEIGTPPIQDRVQLPNHLAD